MKFRQHCFELASIIGKYTINYLCGAVVGLMQADPSVIRETKQMYRLFYHEVQRVFHDRLINSEDKMYFYQILADMANKYFSEVG